MLVLYRILTFYADAELYRDPERFKRRGDHNPMPVRRTQSQSRARTGVMTFLCQPLQVLIEIHPSMEDFDDFERVRFLAQNQEV